MIKRTATLIIIITFIIIMISYTDISHSISQTFSYGQWGCIDCELNSDESKLYVSYYNDNKVLEIDTITMHEIRNFNVDSPTIIKIDANDQYLYVLSHQWPGVLSRILLSNGSISNLQFAGEVQDVILDSSNNRLWVLHRVFPTPDDYYQIEDATKPENQGSGRISEVQISNFTIIRTVNIPSVPASFLYSSISDSLYTLHDLRYIPIDGPILDGSYLEVRNAISLAKTAELVWGKTADFCGLPPVASYWSDDGRYIAFPSPARGNPEFSFRIIDTSSNSIVSNVVFPDFDSQAVTIKYIHKVPDKDVVWAAVYGGTPQGIQEGVRSVIRISPSNMEYLSFEVPEADETNFGDFAVSSDCDTIYITQPFTGEIIKFEAPNTNPTCFFKVVTQMPYSGPSPAAIVFDATDSYDPDPCDELTYEWDFDGDLVFSEPVDDAYNGDPANPTHNYTSDYTGPVNLRVTDSHSAFSIYTCTIVVDIQ